MGHFLATFATVVYPMMSNRLPGGMKVGVQKRMSGDD